VSSFYDGFDVRIMAGKEMISFGVDQPNDVLLEHDISDDKYLLFDYSSKKRARYNKIVNHLKHIN